MQENGVQNYIPRRTLTKAWDADVCSLCVWTSVYVDNKTEKSSADYRILYSGSISHSVD